MLLLLLLPFFITIRLFPINFSLKKTSSGNYVMFLLLVCFSSQAGRGAEGEIFSCIGIQFWTILLSIIDLDSYSSPSITLGKNTQMPSKNSELPSKSSRKSSAGSYGAQTSASGGTLLAFTSVLIGWILAVLEIS